MITVLVADDEPDMRWALTTFLKKHGFQVLTAENGKKAIDIFKSDKPDLIILDIRMPEIDGMEVLDYTRKVNINLPVIMMTAFSDINNAVKAIKMGAYHYLVKPFDNDELFCSLIALWRKNRYPKKSISFVNI